MVTPAREIKQGDKTVTERGAGHENKGACPYSEYLSWDLDDQESALQSSM